MVLFLCVIVFAFVGDDVALAAQPHVQESVEMKPSLKRVSQDNPMVSGCLKDVLPPMRCQSGFVFFMKRLPQERGLYQKCGLWVIQPQAASEPLPKRSAF